MNYLFKILITSIAIVLTTYLLSSGVHIDGFTTAILVAIVISFLNIFVKPVLVILTIPVTIFSFGFFLLVINAFIILLTSKFITGFKVDGFWWAFLFSIILTFITSILDNLTKKRVRNEMTNRDSEFII
jgi:putative membrane protein